EEAKYTASWFECPGCSHNMPEDKPWPIQPYMMYKKRTTRPEFVEEYQIKLDKKERKKAKRKDKKNKKSTNKPDKEEELQIKLDKKEAKKAKKKRAKMRKAPKRMNVDFSMLPFDVLYTIFEF